MNLARNDEILPFKFLKIEKDMKESLIKIHVLIL